MKSYTNIKQSNKLVEILLPESADMCLTFVNNMWNPVWGKAKDIYQLHKDNYEPDYTKDKYVDFDEFEPKVVPCWSLTALLEVLPKQIGRYTKTLYWFDDAWHCEYVDEDSEGKYGVTADNSVDACVKMITKLKENNLL